MEKGLVEIWMKYGTGEGERLIPMHILGNIIKPKLCKIILKAHILTGCDVTSKVGTKLAALNSDPELYLESFGESEMPSTEVLKRAEQYLVQVLKKNSQCENFDKLRYLFTF